MKKKVNLVIFEVAILLASVLSLSTLISFSLFEISDENSLVLLLTPLSIIINNIVFNNIDTFISITLNNKLILLFSILLLILDISMIYIYITIQSNLLSEMSTIILTIIIFVSMFICASSQKEYITYKIRKYDMDKWTIK